MIETIIQNIYKNETQLQLAVDNNLDISEVDAIAKQLDANIDRLTEANPDNFTDAIKLFKCVLSLIENAHDDIGLIKKYTLILKHKLDYLENSISFLSANRSN